MAGFGYGEWPTFAIQRSTAPFLPRRAGEAPNVHPGKGAECCGGMSGRREAPSLPSRPPSARSRSGAGGFELAVPEFAARPAASAGTSPCNS